MDSFQKIVKKNKLSVGFVILFIVSGGFLLAKIQKGDVVIWLNDEHTIFWDYFLMFFNKLAEWVWLLSVLFFLYKTYWGIVTSIVFAVNGLVVQFFKIIVFDYPRPSVYLKDVDPVISFGMELSTRFSFPSGHTNAMFVGGVIVGLLSKNRFLLLLGLISGLLAGVSRVYFFQHFFMDIYAGGILAIFLTTILFVWLENSKLNSERFQKPFWKKS